MTIDQWFFLASDGERYQLMAALLPSRASVSVTQVRATNVQRGMHSTLPDLSVKVLGEFMVTAGVRTAVEAALNDRLISNLAAA